MSDSMLKYSMCKFLHCFVAPSFIVRHYIGTTIDLLHSVCLLYVMLNNLQVGILKRVLEEVEKVMQEFRGMLYKSMEDPRLDLAEVSGTWLWYLSLESFRNYLLLLTAKNGLACKFKFMYY